jgi:hypothetical protein
MGTSGVVSLLLVSDCMYITVGVLTLLPIVACWLPGAVPCVLSETRSVEVGELQVLLVRTLGPDTVLVVLHCGRGAELDSHLQPFPNRHPMRLACRLSCLTWQLANSL